MKMLQSDIATNKGIDSKNDDEIQNLKTDFETALTLTGVGKYSYVVLIFSIYTLLIANTEIFSVGLVTTSAQCDLDLDVHKKGLISAMPMLGVVSGAHFWGYLADTRGRRFAMIISISGTAVLGILSSLANHWILLAFTKYLSALCASGTLAVIFTLLGESIPVISRSRYLFYASTGLMLTQTTVAVIAYPILNLEFSYHIPFLNYSYKPWRLYAQAIGVFHTLNLIMLLTFIVETPKYHFSSAQYEKGLGILKTMYEINNGKSKEHYAVNNVSFSEVVNTDKHKNVLRMMWDQTVPLFSGKYLKSTLLVSYISICAYGVAPPFAFWLPEIFNAYSDVGENTNIRFCYMFQYQNLNESANEIIECSDRISKLSFIALLIFSIYLTTVAMIFVVIVKYIDKKWMFIIFHLISFTSAVLINNITLKYGIIFLFSTMTNAVAMAITTNYAVELFPTYLRAMGVCLTMMVGKGVSFILTNIIGSQFESNCSTFLYILATFILSGVLVGFLLPLEKKSGANDASLP